MAQTGYTPISIYYSATTTNVPTAGNLVAGELAINTADGKLFYKDSSGVVQTIASKNGVAGGSNTQVQYNSSGSLAGSANMTFNGTTLTLANDASISGLTVGKGGGAIVTNTAVGTNALNGNSIGIQNAAFGAYTLQNNTTNNNAGFGYASLPSVTSGGGNSAFGYASAYSTTTGILNVAIGSQALYSNTTASNNTAVGYQAGYSNTTGGSNVFIGNTSGYSATASNGFNTFVGASSGYLVTTGYYNTIIGGYNGNQGGLDIRTANNYIVLADGAGNPRGVFDGSGNLAVGDTNNGSTGWATSKLFVSGGYTQLKHSDGPLLLWNTTNSGTRTLVIFDCTVGSTRTDVGSITYNGTTTLYNSTSDQRLKENIVDAGSGLAKISNVKVRSFDWIASKQHTDFGVIAQEINSIAPELVSTGEDNPDGTIKTPWQVDTSVLVPAMIKAIQELNEKITALEAQIGNK